MDTVNAIAVNSSGFPPGKWNPRSNAANVIGVLAIPNETWDAIEVNATALFGDILPLAIVPSIILSVDKLSRIPLFATTMISWYCKSIEWLITLLRGLLPSI